MSKRTGMARKIIGAFIVMMVIVLFFSIKGRPQSIKFIVEKTDPEAQTETTNIRAIRTDKDGVIEFTADKSFAYPDNQPLKMINVYAIVSPNDKEHTDKISIEAEEMRIYEKSGEQPERIEWSGLVKVVSKNRLIIADKLIYIPIEKKYYFIGSPVKVIESCRETTAEEVVVNKSDNTIVFRGKNLRTFSTLKENCEDKNKKEVSTTSFSMYQSVSKGLSFY